ncbi:hypothetical protein Smar_1562 [Staphylothermus marinus F1]|uniref:Uncharacterized protein n=1 Tax=Staphylothermus marinus (strain ATCC 43588 / DSM 3639 / JCM 9404 / F1) TaxID=399550 RepID=A3DPT7_STAMF|nr:hypothetical protein Smar_1562 [Staphylothermus marinus F1]
MVRITYLLICIFFILVCMSATLPATHSVGMQVFNSGGRLVYHVSGYAIPIKNISSFEPVTVDLLLRGVDEVYSMDRSYVENLLSRIGANVSFNAGGIRVFYNYSEEAGRSEITYKLGPDGWYWVDVPAGPCMVHGLPLLLKLSGTVHVKRINSSAIKVCMKALISDIFQHNLSNYKILVKYPSMFPENFNGSIEVSLTYTIINNTAVSGNEVIGFSPLYIVYPRNALEVKEVYDKGLILTFYGIPLKFRMEKTTSKILGHVISYSYIVVYARSNRLISLARYISKMMNQGAFTEDMEPRYRGKPLTKDLNKLENLALRLVIKHENITKYITYAPSKGRYITFISFYKGFELPYNPHGRVVDYRWVYPLSFWAIFLKLKLSNDKYLWVVFWGDAIYGENINPYSIDIGYYNPPSPSIIDVRQLLLFIGVSALPIILIIYFTLKRK